MLPENGLRVICPRDVWASCHHPSKSSFPMMASEGSNLTLFDGSRPIDAGRSMLHIMGEPKVNQCPKERPLLRVVVRETVLLM